MIYDENGRKLTTLSEFCRSKRKDCTGRFRKFVEEGILHDVGVHENPNNKGHYTYYLFDDCQKLYLEKVKGIDPNSTAISHRPFDHFKLDQMSLKHTVNNLGTVLYPDNNEILSKWHVSGHRGELVKLRQGSTEIYASYNQILFYNHDLIKEKIVADYAREEKKPND